ncbi:hypothetical protein GJ744_005284 [Endocarpon pusillum]|uniref:AAA+ ATPase domain-containing protein n=1 Tax=Endocarpon pusillum TaxID=364733 RepID=A0A8H7A8Q9_9EURO|nr:hypothetical protein GJ744_005284 [Endocarpon pusillum]
MSVPSIQLPFEPMEKTNKTQRSSQSDTTSYSDTGDSQQTESEIRNGAEGTVNELEATQGQEQPPTVYPDSGSADLHCPKAGRSHSELLIFGVKTCPMCEQNLHPRKPNGTEDCLEKDEEVGKNKDGGAKQGGVKGDSNESALVKDNSEENAGEDEANAKASSDIVYKIMYKDGGQHTITTEPWGEPFDLEKARRGLKHKKLPVLEIMTVLDTDIEKDSYRTKREVQVLMEEGILENEKISVTVASADMTINSPALIKVLSKIVSYYPGVNLDGKFITLREPYCIIAHHMKELEDFQKTYRPSERQDLPGRIDNGGDMEQCETCDEETHDHIKILLDVFAAAHGDRIEKEEALYAQEPPLATFSMLWLLFKPGATAYAEVQGKRAACVIQSVTADPLVAKKFEKRKPYEIKIWYLDFDGHYLGRCSATITIPDFDGEREITSLKVIPSEYLDKMDGGALRKQLESRGEKFYRLLSGAQMDYSGMTLGSRKRRYEGRVIIDSATYYNLSNEATEGERPQIGPVEDGSEPKEVVAGCNCEKCNEARTRRGVGGKSKWAAYDNIDPKEVKSLAGKGLTAGCSEKHCYLLCGRRLMGFLLKSRKWEALDVECCDEPKVNAGAIDNLVMPERRKNTIKALVHRYANPSALGGNSNTATPWTADFIRNKGEGQIFLLHGSPGVGKTYTAECIAEFTQRPLLSLTCGDIGTDEVRMENQLSKWFKLGEVWGAIMLIDEADVYLERRQTADLKRNSLVTVFLRSMEYYRGILFLTTNRVGHFDDAFISRIHVIIRYDKLRLEDREKIWRQFFAKLKKERKDIEVDPDAKSYVLKNTDMRNNGWNGREIRNAFQTAVALAEYRFAEKKDKENEKVVLEEQDFEEVCQMSTSFKEYLATLSGADEAARAKIDGARFDDFDDEVVEKI